MLAYKIVPNDKRNQLLLLLKEVWQDIPEQKCLVCYTDNVKTDSSFVSQAHTACFPEDPYELTILLDVFHAKNRVTSEMTRSHPDFKAANADLGTLLANLQIPDIYPQKNNFHDALTQWFDDYSKVHASLALPINEKIRFFGNCEITFEINDDLRIDITKEENKQNSIA